MVRLPPNKVRTESWPLQNRLTLTRAALEDTPHAAPPLVRLQSVSEIPVGFEFVRGHGRQGAVPRSATALPSQRPASSSSCRRAPFPDHRIETTGTWSRVSLRNHPQSVIKLLLAETYSTPGYWFEPFMFSGRSLHVGVVMTIMIMPFDQY